MDLVFKRFKAFLTECLDCRGEFNAAAAIPFRGCEADPDDPSIEGSYKGEPACPLCGGLL